MLGVRDKFVSFRIAGDDMETVKPGSVLMHRVLSALGLVLIAVAVSRPAIAGTVMVRVVDTKGAPVAQAVASLHPLEAPAPGPAPASALHATMDQKGFSFVPQVLAVRVGTRVDFPNSDQVRHHVYSFSKAKRFELQLYSGSHAPPVLFDKPGVVVLGCNIHDWMLGYIVVLDTPYFRKSGSNGQIFLNHVPAGSYQLRLWHPRLDGAKKILTRHVVIPAHGVVQQVFKVSLHARELTNKPPAGLDIGNAGHAHARP